MLFIYGIPNCDKVRKTRQYLEKNNIEYTFHDFRKDGVSASMLNRWCKNLAWENILNKQSTSFRKLPDHEKTAISQERAVDLMLRIPTLIKRPVIELGNYISVGCSEADLQALIEIL